MEVCFVGPLGVVTGSCTWMRDFERNWSFLIDCGMQQGESTAADWNAGAWPFDPAEIKFVVLTHAHIDHCGLLPLLYKKGFVGNVYCTRETAEIAQLLLTDAAKHQGAPFNKNDVNAVKWVEPGSGKQLGTYLPVDTDLFLQFFRTGHVMGAVSVVVRWGAPGDGQKSMVFSGDLGPNGEDEDGLPLMRFRMNPIDCDYAVVESTYGGTVRDKEMSSSEVRRSVLRQMLDQIIESQGTLVVPAFSFGRTQDVLFDLHWIAAETPEKYRQITYFLDSPLASHLHSAILKGFDRLDRTAAGKVRPRWLGKQVFDIFGLDKSDAIQHDECIRLLRACLCLTVDSKFESSSMGNLIAKKWRPIISTLANRDNEVLKKNSGPRVVVTSSGSCDGGAVAAWLPAILPSMNGIVALVGYASETSVAGSLARLVNTPLSERARDNSYLVWDRGVTFPISRIGASIFQLRGYSAHADQNGLLNWLYRPYKGVSNAAGRVVFIQHGGNTQRSYLESAVRKRAQEYGKNVEVFQPSDPQEWWDLERGARALSTESKKAEIAAKIARLIEEAQRLEATTA